MAMESISKEYTLALFSLAAETHQEEAFGEAVKKVQAQFEQEPAYLSLLSAPDIPRKERERILAEAFHDLPGPVLSFVQLLAVNGRIRLFPECAAEYAALLDDLKRVTVAKVTSAAPLTAEEKEKLKNKLESISGRSVTLDLSTDPSLIAGLVVEMDGKIIDGSMRSRLFDVKGVIGR